MAGARSPVDGGGALQLRLAIRLLIEFSGRAPYAQSPTTTRVGKSTSEGAKVNGVDQATPQCATTEYPPAEWAANREFKAPGPVSRQLLRDVCTELETPRSSRPARFERHGYERLSPRARPRLSSAATAANSPVPRSAVALSPVTPHDPREPRFQRTRMCGGLCGSAALAGRCPRRGTLVPG